MITMTKKRSEYWQLIRGICILCVIMIHTLYLTNIFYINVSNIVMRRIINFAVAVFIFMAGYFVHVENIGNFYLSKAKRLIIPLVIWDLLYAIINYRSSILNSSIITVLKSFAFSTSAAHLYYIYVLIQLFLITPFLIKLSNSDKYKNFPILITPIYNIILFICKYFFSFNIPLYNYWIFGWISYYYLGIILKKEKDFKFKENNFLILCLFISILEGVLIYASRNELYNLATSQLTFLNSIYSLMFCCLLFNGNKNFKIDNVKSEWVQRMLIKLGNYSFGIYFSHLLILMIVRKMITKLSLNYFENIVLIFLLTTLITYFVNYIYYEKLKELKK